MRNGRKDEHISNVFEIKQRRGSLLNEKAMMLKCECQTRPELCVFGCEMIVWFPKDMRVVWINFIDRLLQPKHSLGALQKEVNLPFNRKKP